MMQFYNPLAGLSPANLFPLTHINLATIMPAEPDARLIVAAAEAIAASEEDIALTREHVEPFPPDVWEQSERLCGTWLDRLDEVERTPATTARGIWAKAKVLMHFMGDIEPDLTPSADVDADAHTALLASILRDLKALAS